MPPSRGVCTACRVRGLYAPTTRLQLASRRQFSAATSLASTARLSSYKSLSSCRSLLLSSGNALNSSRTLTVTQSRLQSTAPASAAASPTATPLNAAPALDTQATALSLPSDYVSSPALAEPAIGWLHDLGLNFGYGPSSCVQFLFEHIHVLTGFPFWGSIVATAVVCRLAMVPLVMQSSDTSSRLAAVAALTKPKMDEMKMAAAVQDQMALQRLRGEVRSIYRSAGVKMWKLGLPFIQLPLGFALWRLTRNMADLPVPGMEAGGILWFVDLTSRDPTFILPFAVAILQHLSVKTGIEGGAGMTNPTMKKFMLFGLPALAVPFIGFAPAAVQLNFTATAAIALFTNTIMRSPALRARIGLAPMIKQQPAAAAPPPYKGTITVSGRAKDHPENIRLAKEAAEAAAKRAEQAVPWTQKVSPRNLVKSGGKLFQGINDSMEKVMPVANQKQKSAVKKRAKKAADEYEKKRNAEIERERVEFERGRRH